MNYERFKLSAAPPANASQPGEGETVPPEVKNWLKPDKNDNRDLLLEDGMKLVDEIDEICINTKDPNYADRIQEAIEHDRIKTGKDHECVVITNAYRSFYSNTHVPAKITSTRKE